MSLVFFPDDVPGAYAAPVAEGSWAGRRHSLHGAALSLVGSVVPRPLALQRRVLNIPLLLILLFRNYPASPSPLPLC